MIGVRVKYQLVNSESVYQAVIYAVSGFAMAPTANTDLEHRSIAMRDHTPKGVRVVRVFPSAAHAPSRYSWLRSFGECPTPTP